MQQNLQLSVKSFSKYGFGAKIFPYASDFTYERSDKFEYNSLKRVIFEKYSRRHCLTQQNQQLSVKYFSRYCFGAKIFPYASDLIYVRSHIRQISYTSVQMLMG